jgi:hypothetical protein
MLRLIPGRQHRSIRRRQRHQQYGLRGLSNSQPAANTTATVKRKRRVDMTV